MAFFYSFIPAEPKEEWRWHPPFVGCVGCRSLFHLPLFHHGYGGAKEHDGDDECANAGPPPLVGGIGAQAENVQAPPEQGLTQIVGMPRIAPQTLVNRSLAALDSGERKGESRAAFKKKTHKLGRGQHPQTETAHLHPCHWCSLSIGASHSRPATPRPPPRCRQQSRRRHWPQCPAPHDRGPRRLAACQHRPLPQGCRAVQSAILLPSTGCGHPGCWSLFFFFLWVFKF